MKSINKLILFFMLIFIGASVTANALDNEGEIFVQGNWMPPNDLNYHINMNMYVYDRDQSVHVYNSWFTRLEDRYRTGLFGGEISLEWYSSTLTKQTRYIMISRNHNYPCELPWYNYEGVLPVKMSPGVRFYITVYEVESMADLPAWNVGKTIVRVGETHMICGYAKHPNFFRFYFTFYPSANLLEIGVQNANEKHSKTYYANSELKIYTSMDNKQSNSYSETKSKVEPKGKVG